MSHSNHSSAPQRTLNYFNAVRDILKAHNYFYNAKQIRTLAGTFHVSTSRINEAIKTGLFKFETSEDLRKLLLPTKEEFTLIDAKNVLKIHSLRSIKKNKPNISQNFNQLRLNTANDYDDIAMLKDLLKLLRQQGYEIKCEITTKKEL